MSDWNYGNAFLQFPIEKGIAVFKDGSTLKVHDIFNSLPKYMTKADLIFCDPPWNQSNIQSFYTKAEKQLEFDFKKFYIRIFPMH
jgi:site-specific DNA-adenine methylase